MSRCPRQNYCQVEGFSNCPTNLKQSIPCNRMSALEEFNFGNISMYLMNDGILSEYDEGFCPIQLYIHSILSEYDVFLLHVFFLFFGGVLIPVGSFFRECQKPKHSRVPPRGSLDEFSTPRGFLQTVVHLGAASQRILSHTIHVWYVYLHLAEIDAKCK